MMLVLESMNNFQFQSLWALNLSLLVELDQIFIWGSVENPMSDGNNFDFFRAS